MKGTCGGEESHIEFNDDYNTCKCQQHKLDTQAIQVMPDNIYMVVELHGRVKLMKQLHLLNNSKVNRLIMDDLIATV